MQSAMGVAGGSGGQVFTSVFRLAPGMPVDYQPAAAIAVPGIGRPAGEPVALQSLLPQVLARYGLDDGAGSKGPSDPVIGERLDVRA
jgi:hypothetical protein